MLPALLRRLVTVLFWAFVTVVVVTALGLVVGPRLLGGEVATVLSGSMEPKYPVGSMLIVVPVDTADIRTGDVITFTAGDRRVSHRVIKIVEADGTRSFVTKGDANNVADREPVPQSAVVGRVEGAVPRLGGWIEAVRNPATVGALVGTVVALLILAFFGKDGRGARKPTNPDPDRATGVTPVAPRSFANRGSAAPRGSDLANRQTEIIPVVRVHPDRQPAWRSNDWFVRQTTQARSRGCDEKAC